MSDEAQTLQIVGTCSEISEKNGWTAFHIMVPGKQYPVRLSTKLPALIEQGRAVGDAVATWTFKESQGGENPNKPGTFFTNRYFEGVELGAAAQPAAPASGSQPVQTGHYEPLPAGDRERSIVRQTSIKAAAELYMGRGDESPSDPNEEKEDWPLQVIKAASRFETWILRDLTPDDELPF